MSTLEHPGGIDIGPPASQDEARAFAEILAESLRFPRLAESDWLSRYELTDIRLARSGRDHGSQLLGGLIQVPMGQWFGGKVVPMVGVHGVGVLPEHRGRGVGVELMRACVRELHERGVPLSGLYPATQPIYRRAGFELAGSLPRYKIPVASLPVGHRELSVVRAGPDRVSEMEPVYASWAAQDTGLLERQPWLWERLLRPANGPCYTFFARRGTVNEGYISFVQHPEAGSNHYDIGCRELVALTRDAWLRLLSLVADHRSMARYLHISVPPGSALWHVLPEQHFEPSWSMYWMSRIVRVPEALEARGYPPGLTAAVRLAVHDDLVPDNTGLYTLEVADGQGRVHKGGGHPDTTPDTKIDIEIGIGGLASLFTGFASAATLAAAGKARGESAALARISALFAGPPPWMPEIY